VIKMGYKPYKKYPKNSKLYNIFGVSKRTGKEVWLGGKVERNARLAITRYRANPIKYGKKVNLDNYKNLRAELHPSEK